ncbi:MAG: CDGSH iron-sulfur domain-containing protein [Nitrososphaerales archaeon]
MAKVVIKAAENGPSLVIVDGKTITALCRCGASNNKPYCDGSHQKIGFKAKEAEVKIL